MKKENIRLKETIALDDKINVIEKVCEFIISKNEYGEVVYMPYAKEYAMDIAIALYLLDGIEFEKDDNIYDIVTTDEEIKAVVDGLNDSDFAFIEEQVKDIVEFRKSMYIHNNNSFDEKLKEILDVQKAFEDLRLEVLKKEDKVLKQQIKANEYQEKVMDKMTPEESAKLNKMWVNGEVTSEQLVDTVVKKYLGSDYHGGKADEIIEAKNAEIKDLKKYKQIHDTRNVVSGK